MHSSRTIVRVPTHACRVSRAAAPSAARSFSYVPTPFFPRFQSPFTSSGGEFAPLFRLFDDIATPALRHVQSPVVYQPRFDVEEVEGAYNLRGELPGVEGKDISVEFTDPQTLVIKGQTERSYSNGAPQATAESTQQDAEITNAAPASTEDATAAQVDNSDAASTHSTGSYVQATVEDDPAEPAISGQATPAESTADQTTAVSDAQQQVESKPTEDQAPASRYWVSERSVGSFQRTFKFPERIDQNEVSASMKNGILNITVPKAPIPAARRIEVQ